MAGWVAAGGRGTFPPFFWLLRLKGHSWHTRCMTAPNNESSVMTQNQTQNKNSEIETAKSLPRRNKPGPIHESNISGTFSSEMIKMLSQAKTNRIDAHNFNQTSGSLQNLSKKFVNYRSTSKARDKKNINFETEEFCDFFINQALPNDWKFESDVAVLINPPSEVIFNSLIKKGQRQIISFETQGFKRVNSLPSVDGVSIYSCHNAEDVVYAFTLIQSIADKISVVPCAVLPDNAKNIKATIHEAIKRGKETRFENTRTVSKFGSSWAGNVITNLNFVTKAHNIHDIELKSAESAVIVASGPSLNKNVSHLAKIQKDVFIISALRSLPVLQSAGVDPDLVIQLDAENDRVAENFDPKSLKKIKNFLFEPIIHPAFLKITAEQYIWSLSQHYFDVHSFFQTKPTPFNVPSVSIYGLCLSKFLGFKNLCFIGQDLAADDEKDYADGATQLLPSHTSTKMFNIEVPGFYGETVKTRNSFNYQIKLCSDLASKWKSEMPNLKLINATEGGAFIDGFEHITLKNFHKSYCLKKPLSQKNVVIRNPNWDRGAQLSEYFKFLEKTFDAINIVASGIIKFDQKN